MGEGGGSTAYDDAQVVDELRAYRRREGLDLDPPDVGRERDVRDGAAARAAGVALWYPEANRRFEMPTQGSYREGYPEGAVVHYTAGRSQRGDADAEATVRGGIKDGFSYFCVSSTGKVYQTAPLDRWGSHAGKSWHPRLGFWVSSRLVGIEVCCAGLLEKTARGYEPWWNENTTSEAKKTFFAEAEVRAVAKQQNVTQAGPYHRYATAQEEALYRLLLWLAGNNPAVFDLDLVLGHDEVGTRDPPGGPGEKVLGRKQDPGGSLSAFMPAFREGLKERAPGS